MRTVGNHKKRVIDCAIILLKLEVGVLNFYKETIICMIL